MNNLKTLKSLTHSEDGQLFVEEYEVEAFRRNEARALENIARLPQNVEGIDPASVVPVIEPLRTWEVGTFTADGAQLVQAALEWLGRRTIPLQDGEIDELRAFLTQQLQNGLQE